ncbi:hypothetical protein PoB_002252700 [Plakobranchus ocellatus]|uniref:Uncharacterized protein n=1 Tax=Plakobranchus ocellatus TaxID=259542 RepID=A0AAV3ZNC3_9GAST|nr:hypothetical protein PoB_002252700 [Plakobranchus ocellatus]
MELKLAKLGSLQKLTAPVVFNNNTRKDTSNNMGSFYMSASGHPECHESPLEAEAEAEAENNHRQARQSLKRLEQTTDRCTLSFVQDLLQSALIRQLKGAARQDNQQIKTGFQRPGQTLVMWAGGYFGGLACSENEKIKTSDLWARDVRRCTKSVSTHRPAVPASTSARLLTSTGQKLVGKLGQSANTIVLGYKAQGKS